MSKIVLTDVTSGYNRSKIQQNFDAIAEELNDKVLYRDNPDGEANQLDNDLDMNSNGVYNASSISTEELFIDGGRVLPTTIAEAPDAVDVDYDNTTSGLSSNNVQDVIDEVYTSQTSAGNTKQVSLLVTNFSDISSLAPNQFIHWEASTVGAPTTDAGHGVVLQSTATQTVKAYIGGSEYTGTFESGTINSAGWVLSVLNVSTIDDLKDIVTPAPNLTVIVSTTNQSGVYVFDSSDQSSNVTSDPTRYVALAGDDGSNGAFIYQYTEYVDVGQYGDTAADIIASMSPHVFRRNQYEIDSSILYTKDEVWRGQGKSFSGGTIIKPTGNFPAFTYDDSQAIQYTKNKFSDFLIDGSNMTTQYAFDITDAFLTNFYDIWIRNAPNGVRITYSDALSFYGLMVMEDSYGDVVTLGNGSRSIKFFGCNFEKNPSNTGDGGIVRIANNESSYAQNYFYGCQWERGKLIVETGSVVVDGAKFGASTTVDLLSKSENCYISGSFDDGTCVHDFGYNNIVKNAYCTNMATICHEWPAATPTTTGADATYGAAGEEWLLLMSGANYTTADVTNATMAVYDGTTQLDVSPTFGLIGGDGSVGLAKRRVNSYLAGVKTTTNPITTTFTNCNNFGVKGGQNILTNGTFDGSTSSWINTDIATSFDGNGDLVITPVNTTWQIGQSLSGLVTLGKKYIAVARFSGEATLCLGSAHNGAEGARPVYDSGYSDLYGDGDTLAMISFDYFGQSQLISLGSVDSSSEVTCKYIMLIEV